MQHLGSLPDGFKYRKENSYSFPTSGVVDDVERPIHNLVLHRAWRVGRGELPLVLPRLVLVLEVDVARDLSRLAGDQE